MPTSLSPVCGQIPPLRLPYAVRKPGGIYGGFPSPSLSTSLSPVCRQLPPHSGAATASLPSGIGTGSPRIASVTLGVEHRVVLPSSRGLTDRDVAPSVARGRRRIRPSSPLAGGRGPVPTERILILQAKELPNLPGAAPTLSWAIAPTLRWLISPLPGSLGRVPSKNPQVPSICQSLRS